MQTDRNKKQFEINQKNFQESEQAYVKMRGINVRLVVKIKDIFKIEDGQAQNSINKDNGKIRQGFDESSLKRTQKSLTGKKPRTFCGLALGLTQSICPQKVRGKSNIENHQKEWKNYRRLAAKQGKD